MTIVESLATYYGLDWAAFLLGTAGLYLVGEQKRIGFLCTFVALISAAIVAVISGQYGFLAGNILQSVLAVRAFVRWKQPLSPQPVEVVSAQSVTPGVVDPMSPQT